MDSNDKGASQAGTLNFYLLFYISLKTHSNTIQIKNFAEKHDMNKDKRRVAYFRAMCKSLKKNVDTSPVSLRRITSASPRTESTFGDTMTNLMPPALRSHLSREGTSIFRDAITKRSKKPATQRQLSAPARL